MAVRWCPHVTRRQMVLWKPFRDSAWSVTLFWQLYTHTHGDTWHTEIDCIRSCYSHLLQWTKQQGQSSLHWRVLGSTHFLGLPRPSTFLPGGPWDTPCPSTVFSLSQLELGAAIPALYTSLLKLNTNWCRCMSVEGDEGTAGRSYLFSLHASLHGCGSGVCHPLASWEIQKLPQELHHLVGSTECRS